MLHSAKLGTLRRQNDTLSDGETKLQLNEFQGKRRLHIRKFKDNTPTHTGVCLYEMEMLLFMDKKLI